MVVGLVRDFPAYGPCTRIQQLDFSGATAIYTTLQPLLQLSLQQTDTRNTAVTPHIGTGKESAIVVTMRGEVHDCGVLHDINVHLHTRVNNGGICKQMVTFYPLSYGGGDDSEVQRRCYIGGRRAWWCSISRCSLT